MWHDPDVEAAHVKRSFILADEATRQSVEGHEPV